MLSLYSSVPEMCRAVAERVKTLRLAQELTQSELARRSDVALATLRYFERTGRISFERLLRLAVTLRALDAFDALFALPEVRSLAQLEARMVKRKHGRRRA